MPVKGFKHTELPKSKEHLKIYVKEMTKSLDKGQYRGEDRSKAIHLLQTARSEIKR